MFESRRLDRKDGTAGLKSNQRPLEWAAADLGAARKGDSAPPLSGVLHFRPHLPPYNAMAEIWPNARPVHRSGRDNLSEYFPSCASVVLPRLYQEQSSIQLSH